MYDRTVREQAARMLDAGLSLNATSKRLGVSRAAIRQREIVEEYPGRFLRGLFHSDGCRFTNWTVRTIAGQPKRYEYPRYMFSNKSTDIIGLCTWALNLLEIPWRMCRPDLVSVARREAVAALDVHVGPKA